jgi:signal transduction histidine kinase
MLMGSQRRQRAALSEANRELAQYAALTEQLAVTQERNRLARELHDTLAHSLSAAAVQIEAVQALWDGDGAAAKKMLDQALQITRNGLTEARGALHALRASPLQDLGLSLAVRHLAESIAARSGLRLDLHIGAYLDNLSPEVEQCIYRVAQEALANVARHANAASAHVALVQETDICGSPLPTTVARLARARQNDRRHARCGE